MDPVPLAPDGVVGAPVNGTAGPGTTEPGTTAPGVTAPGTIPSVLVAPFPGIVPGAAPAVAVYPALVDELPAMDGTPEDEEDPDGILVGLP